MTELSNYLSFDGNCAEAMRFYEKALNGKLVALLTHAQTPIADQTPPADADRIMHARLEFDGGVLMAGDAPSASSFAGMKGFSLALSYDTEEQGRRVFEALSEGGKVTMPYGETFWAKGFGMVTDRFGTPWMVNGAMLPMPA